MKNFGAIKLADLVKYMAICVFELAWFGFMIVISDYIYLTFDEIGDWLVMLLSMVIVNLILGIIIEGVKRILKGRKEHEVKFDDQAEVFSKEELEEMFSI